MFNLVYFTILVVFSSFFDIFYKFVFFILCNALTEVDAAAGPHTLDTPVDTACKAAKATDTKNSREAASDNSKETVFHDMTKEVSATNFATNDTAAETSVDNDLTNSITNEEDARDIVITESLTDAEFPTDRLHDTPTEAISSAGSNGITKQSIRLRIWRYLEEHHLALFPRPVYNRIPNFRGAMDAAKRLKTVDRFWQAKTVLVSYISIYY